MAQFAIVKNNVVVNVISWDGQSDYTPPEGCSLVQNDSCGIGYTYDPVAQTFSPPAGPLCRTRRGCLKSQTVFTRTPWR